MAKFYGKIGYVEVYDESDGIYSERIVERPYYGDVTRNSRRLEKGEGVNDNINVGNTISIVADAYAYENFFAMRYVEWMGAKWKITDVEVDRPRLTLTIGGVYNGAEAGTQSETP